MADQKETDISSLDFESWIKLVFDHPITTPPGEDWYWNSCEEFIVTNPQRLLEHFTKLCLNFTDVSTLYTLPQVDQGIWFLLSGPICLGQFFVETSVPLEIRSACISSMLHVFEDFVAKSKVEVMENCFSMWWDLVCHDFWNKLNARGMDYEAIFKPLEAGKILEKNRKLYPEISYEHLNPEDKAVLDAMFQTLSKILNLKENRSMEYALHGLGHLKHPAAKVLIQDFIDKNHGVFSQENMAWIESCRDGTVM